MMACGFACAQEGVSKDAKKSKPEEKSESQKISIKDQSQPELSIENPNKDAERTKAKEGTLQEDEILKISEAFGHFIGRNLNTPGVKFDVESIIKGMREGVAGKPAPMSDQEYEAMMSKLQEQSFSALSETNLKAANEFLAKNSKEADVIELVPGQLQYTVLKEGHGAVVEEHFSPQINYTGKYLDGTVFGSSDDAGGPITIPLDQTIPGFSKGLLGMKEGEKRKLFVHPGLAYGTTGQLPPNSLLIFEVEVVKANAEKAPKSSVQYSENDDLDDDLHNPELSLNEFSEGDEEQDSDDSVMEQPNLQALADEQVNSNKMVKSNKNSDEDSNDSDDDSDDTDEDFDDEGDEDADDDKNEKSDDKKIVAPVEAKSTTGAASKE